MKETLKFFILILVLIISIPGLLFSKKNNIFVSNFNRQNVGGPRRFLFNLNNYLNTKGIKIRNLYLGDVKYLLILSNPSSEFIYIIANLLNLKIITRVDGFYTSFYFKNNKPKTKIKFQKLFNFKLKKALIKSDFVIYQSNFSKEILDQELYNRKKNFSIILNPVDIYKFIPNKNKIKLFNIMLLGVWRDLELLKCSIDTLKYLNTDTIKTINIIGPLKNNIKSNLINYINNYRDYDFKINLLGEIKYNDLDNKIRKNSILLHLKSGDWCPNAVIEAMSCGLPVVCQEYGGVKEIIGDSGQIIYYESHKYDKNLSKLAAKAINRILENYELYSIKSRNRAENYHDISKVCENYFIDIID